MESVSFETSTALFHPEVASVHNSVIKVTSRHIRASVSNLVWGPVVRSTEIAIFTALWECLNDLFFEEI